MRKCFYFMITMLIGASVLAIGVAQPRPDVSQGPHVRIAKTGAVLSGTYEKLTWAGKIHLATASVVNPALFKKAVFAYGYSMADDKIQQFIHTRLDEKEGDVAWGIKVGDSYKVITPGDPFWKPTFEVAKSIRNKPEAFGEVTLEDEAIQQKWSKIVAELAGLKSAGDVVPMMSSGGTGEIILVSGYKNFFDATPSKTIVMWEPTPAIAKSGEKSAEPADE